MAAVKSGKGKANSATPPGRKPGMTEKQHRDKQDKLAKAKSDNSSNKPPVKVTAASSSNSAPSSSPSSLAPAATVVAQKVVAAARKSPSNSKLKFTAPYLRSTLTWRCQRLSSSTARWVIMLRSSTHRASRLGRVRCSTFACPTWCKTCRQSTHHSHPLRHAELTN